MLLESLSILSFEGYICLMLSLGTNFDLSMPSYLSLIDFYCFFPNRFSHELSAFTSVFNSLFITPTLEAFRLFFYIASSV